jgi:outer membrane lipoprotein-sorting protein
MKKLTLLILFLFLTRGMASAQTALSPAARQKFLVQLQQNLGKSRTIQSKFTQEKHLSLFNDALVSSGLFAFAAPDRLRWEVTQPFHSLLIMNGREVAKYDFPDGKNPRKLQFPAANALSEVLQQIADIHQGKFEAEAKSYNIEVYRGETERMTLVPQDPQMKKIISQIDIGFSKGLDRVASVVIREKGGDFTKIIFEDDPRNPTLPDSLFSIP